MPAEILPFAGQKLTELGAWLRRYRQCPQAKPKLQRAQCQPGEVTFRPKRGSRLSRQKASIMSTATAIDIYMRQIYPIALLCNNERGHCTGKVGGIDVMACAKYDLVLEFESTWLDEAEWPPLIRPVSANYFEIDARKFFYDEYHPYHGNLCWDYFAITGSTLVNLLAFLRTRDDFSLTAGWTSISEAYESGTFGSEQLKEIFES